MSACINLLRTLGADVIGAAFLLEIPALKGRERLGDIAVCSLIQE